MISEKIKDIYKKTQIAIENGNGPFYAVIYDNNDNIIAEAANSVVIGKNPTQHAEMNAIAAACKKLGTYDLAPYNLSIYVNAEPCMMCAGAIMWSGIKNIYYGVPSKRVEEITGFDEGFKPDWLEEFKKRGISIQGEIEQSIGEEVLQSYIDNNNEVYKPSR